MTGTAPDLLNLLFDTTLLFTIIYLFCSFCLHVADTLDAAEAVTLERNAEYDEVIEELNDLLHPPITLDRIGAALHLLDSLPDL